jgi:hypothetical protein
MALLSRCWPLFVRVPSLTVRMLSSTVKVPLLTANIPTSAVRVPQSTIRVLLPIAKVPSSAVKMPLILQCRGQKRLSLQDELMVESIGLDVWIFTLAPRWVPTVVVCDNDLE